MSAFVVSKEHIDALVSAGLTLPQYHEPMRWYHNGKAYTLERLNADLVGQVLVSECVKSVSYRYPNDDVSEGELPGPIDAYYTGPYRFATRAATPVEVLKHIACYRYQSCEHPGWEQSNAAAYCDALTWVAINRLPGYEEAPWGL